MVRVNAVSNSIQVPENQASAKTIVQKPFCKQAITITPSVCELETRWPLMP